MQSNCISNNCLLYSAKFWQGKTLVNLSKKDFGEANVLNNFGESSLLK